MDYKNGKIYKIESHLGDKINIGSTTKKYLSQRMDQHRSDYKRWKNGTRGITRSFTLFEEYGVENCSIILIELCSCSSKDELNSKEAHYIKTLECVNKKVPGRTKSEYRKDNPEKIRTIANKFYHKNKEAICEYKQQKYECECGSHICLGSKSEHNRTKKHTQYLGNN